jgi:hypothetical protein
LCGEHIIFAAVQAVQRHALQCLVAALHSDDAVRQHVTKHATTAASTAAAAGASFSLLARCSCLILFCDLLLLLCCSCQLMVLAGVAVALVQASSQQHVMMAVKHARCYSPTTAATANTCH